MLYTHTAIFTPLPRTKQARKHYLLPPTTAVCLPPSLVRTVGTSRVCKRFMPGLFVYMLYCEQRLLSILTAVQAFASNLFHLTGMVLFLAARTL